MSLASYLEAAPKAELHVHLEGAIQPATLLQLARRNNMTLPADTVEGLRQHFVFHEFSWNRFREINSFVKDCVRTAADFELLVYEFGSEMARQNIRYAEITTSPSIYARRNIPHEVFFSGLTRGRERAQHDFGVEIGWIFCLARNIDDPEISKQRADYTLSAAIEGMSDGVVALGLAHVEEGYPPEPFAPWFNKARIAGLHTTAHAGELLGPSSVWGALQELKAERIGHGVRSIEDPQLVEYLAEKQILLEICPTSNLLLGVYPNLEQHPLRRLYEAGVIVTINSDDPAPFNTTLNHEVALLNTAFGFDVATIDEILLNGVRHSFLPPACKEAVETEFRAEMAALKLKHSI